MKEYKPNELVQKIVDAINAEDFSLNWYDEKGVVCGAEIESWTAGGVDMIPFLDFRDKDINDPADWIEEITETVNNFDIDDEIDAHRQDPSYKSAFTYRASVEDFEGWTERLRSLLAAVEKAAKK